MKRISKLALLLSISGAALGMAVSATPDLPRSAGPLIYARPFVLEHAYRLSPRSETMVTAGYLVVLSTDPELAQFRSTGGATLLIDGKEVERINSGGESGNVVVIVPDGIDLRRSRAWFDEPGPREGQDPNWSERSTARARTAGIPLLDVDAAASQGVGARKLLELRDKTALLDVAARLILTHSPEDRHLAAHLQTAQRLTGSARGVD